ncbi:permease prefix domain 1-containing protein [Calidifontibacillus oryziterrae]|uniref:permease prefix domain 1-containing protein n=1 Tax=Calidifontibacillus oryziterrae TaxID=1191699 RepID=UPI0002EFC979|nr:permease prefix domain 1-containing protein [Calidifontibacillus oryziterrae]
MNRLEQYITEILANVECNDIERADLKEELLTHLAEAKFELMQKGLSEQEAEEQAIQGFGKAERLGNNLQRSMYPYRKNLLLFIGFGTIVFSLACYFHNVIMFSDNTYIVLALSILIGSMIVFAAVNPVYFSNRKIAMNVLLISLFPFYFINFLIIDTMSNWYIPLLNVLGFLLVISSIWMIFLTALKPPTNKRVDEKTLKRRKIVHVINITIGIIAIGFSMLFSFGVLIFAGPNPVLFVPAAIIFAWGLLYWWQIKLVDRKAAK